MGEGEKRKCEGVWSYKPLLADAYDQTEQWQRVRGVSNEQLSARITSSQAAAAEPHEGQECLAFLSSSHDTMAQMTHGGHTHTHRV